MLRMQVILPALLTVKPCQEIATHPLPWPRSNPLGSPRKLLPPANASLQSIVARLPGRIACRRNSVARTCVRYLYSDISVEPIPATRSRFFYVDNLRWTMIILVVSMHSAVTYSGFGSWYYVEKTALSRPVLFFFITYQSYLQAFFMGFLFFLAGYFVPPSFDRKGAVLFLRDRAYRLGLPVLFYIFVLGPFTEYFVAKSWRSSKPSSFANEWVKHICDGEFLSGTGPLWFCLALLLFCLSYTGLRLLSSGRAHNLARFEAGCFGGLFVSSARRLSPCAWSSPPALLSTTCSWLTSRSTSPCLLPVSGPIEMGGSRRFGTGQASTG